MKWKGSQALVYLGIFSLSGMTYASTSQVGMMPKLADIDAGAAVTAVTDGAENLIVHKSNGVTNLDVADWAAHPHPGTSASSSYFTYAGSPNLFDVSGPITKPVLTWVTCPDPDNSVYGTVNLSGWVDMPNNPAASSEGDVDSNGNFQTGNFSMTADGNTNLSGTMSGAPYTAYLGIYDSNSNQIGWFISEPCGARK